MPPVRLLKVRVAMGVLVALIGMLGFVDFLSHTDDGCEVEVHCLACRAHIGAVTNLVAQPPHAFGVDAILFLPRTADQRPTDESSSLLPPGRAPPVSA